jgi:hypothetical protein
MAQGHPEKQLMDLHKILKPLVIALPLLVVGFAIFMAGHALAQSMQDRTGAAIYWHLSTACLLLLAGNVVLIVGVLGYRALDKESTDQRSMSDE